MTRVEFLPPGEWLTQPLPPYGVPWSLKNPSDGHARVAYRQGVLYIAMKHGKQWPDDLTACDHDRLAALGYLVEGAASPLPE